MSYQALARKWRPQIFAQLMGQEHVVAALSNALSNDRLHHAYLFTGTRGVGKTTIARIFAKSLNCENGVTAEPCGQCQHCVAIEEGRFVDLVEVDAASRTKVEDTREILDNVQYKPTQGRYKVYLIDEVHMLSRHSFNALLKTLEEPPPHIKFLLATTDPQKLPVTILSRCLQFSLKAMTLAQIETQLSTILTAEKINFQPNALVQLAKAANGSMRDALSLTDQAVAQGNGQVDEETVRSMLGLLDEKHISKLVIAIMQNDFAAAMQAVEELSHAAVDAEQVLIELMNSFHQIALIQSLPDYAQLNEQLAELLSQAAQLWPAEQIQLYYQICLRGRRDLAFAAHPRAGLEMTLMRLFAFNPISIEREEVFSAKKIIKKPQPAIEQASNHAVDPRQNSTPLEADANEQESEKSLTKSDDAVNPITEPTTESDATANDSQDETHINNHLQAEVASEFKQNSDLITDRKVDNSNPTHVDNAELASNSLVDENVEFIDSETEALTSIEQLNAQQAQIVSLAKSQFIAVDKVEPNDQVAAEDAPLISTEQASPVDNSNSFNASDAELASYQQYENYDVIDNDIDAKYADNSYVDNSYVDNSYVDNSDIEHYQADIEQPAHLAQAEILAKETEVDKQISQNIPSMLLNIRATKEQKTQQQALIESEANHVTFNIPNQQNHVAQDEVAEQALNTSTAPSSMAEEGLADTESPPWSSDWEGDMFANQVDQPTDMNSTSQSGIEKSKNDQNNKQDLADDLAAEQINQPVAPAINSAQTATLDYSTVSTVQFDEGYAGDENAQRDRALRKQSAAFSQLELAKHVREGVRKSYDVNEWAALVEKLGLSGLQRQFALHSTYSVAGNTVYLQLSHAQKHLNTEHNCKIVADKLSQILQKPVELQVKIQTEIETTPYQIQQEIEDCRQDFAQELINSDTNVQALLSQFSGEIITGSIKPM